MRNPRTSPRKTLAAAALATLGLAVPIVGYPLAAEGDTQDPARFPFPGTARAHVDFNPAGPLHGDMRIRVAADYIDTSRLNSRVYNFRISANETGNYNEDPALTYSVALRGRRNGHGVLISNQEGTAAKIDGRIRSTEYFNGIRGRSLVVLVHAHIKFGDDQDLRIVFNIPR
jgi:hypothetical protein